MSDATAPRGLILPDWLELLARFLVGGTFVYESDWTDVGTGTSGHVWTRGELRSSTTDADTGYGGI